VETRPANWVDLFSAAVAAASPPPLYPISRLLVRAKLHLFHRHSGRVPKFGLARIISPTSPLAAPESARGSYARRYAEDMQSITWNIKRLEILSRIPLTKIFRVLRHLCGVFQRHVNVSRSTLRPRKIRYFHRRIREREIKNSERNCDRSIIGNYALKLVGCKISTKCLPSEKPTSSSPESLVKVLYSARLIFNKYISTRSAWNGKISPSGMVKLAIPDFLRDCNLGFAYNCMRD